MTPGLFAQSPCTQNLTDTPCADNLYATLIRTKCSLIFVRIIWAQLYIIIQTVEVISEQIPLYHLNIYKSYNLNNNYTKIQKKECTALIVHTIV